jgi:hypothetical protein
MIDSPKKYNRRFPSHNMFMNEVSYFPLNAVRDIANSVGIIYCNYNIFLKANKFIYSLDYFNEIFHIKLSLLWEEALIYKLTLSKK